jgi:hypothetical protein
LNKAETAAKHGEEKEKSGEEAMMFHRRALEKTDPRYPAIFGL